MIAAMTALALTIIVLGTIITITRKPIKVSGRVWEWLSKVADVKF